MIASFPADIRTAQLSPPSIESGGYCRRCGRGHSLGPGNTLRYCRQLMDLLADHRTIDLFSSQSPLGAKLTTDWLFGAARGKMFGVLECLRPDGTTAILRAFSGQYNGYWLVEGWVPPLFDVDIYSALNKAKEPRIKALSEEIESCKNHDEKWSILRKERHQLSRQLMQELHSLYQLNNFRGETARLDEVFLGKNGIPTGTGDCCAPKLLSFAAGHNLQPIGLSEFYWGRTNSSGTRQHGSFSVACMEKCTPILGYILCGLDKEER
jgi:hypothetical protein